MTNDNSQIKIPVFPIHIPEIKEKAIYVRMATNKTQNT